MRGIDNSFNDTVTYTHTHTELARESLVRDRRNTEINTYSHRVVSGGSFHWNHSFIEVNGEHHHLPVSQWLTRRALAHQQRVILRR